MKRILISVLSLFLIMATLSSCGTPKIEEVEGRLSELIEASYGVNDILFGEGPATYERAEDPKASMKYYEAEGGQRYYYFYIDDAEAGKILAYRTKSYGDDYNYLVLKSEEEDGKTALYFDGESYYYEIDYVYRELEFYYDESFPEGYEVVRLDEEIRSCEDIKEYAKTVYSDEYLAEIYETLFTGVLVSDDMDTGFLGARYIEFENSDGARWFMKSSEYKPLVRGRRIFDVSTAKILRGSNDSRLRIEMETYIESEPSVRLAVCVNLVKQDGEWFLDSPTY